MRCPGPLASGPGQRLPDSRRLKVGGSTVWEQSGSASWQSAASGQVRYFASTTAYVYWQLLDWSEEGHISDTEVGTVDFANSGAGGGWNLVVPNPVRILGRGMRDSLYQLFVVGYDPDLQTQYPFRAFPLSRRRLIPELTPEGYLQTTQINDKLYPVPWNSTTVGIALSRGFQTDGYLYDFTDAWARGAQVPASTSFFAPLANTLVGASGAYQPVTGQWAGSVGTNPPIYAWV